MRRCIYCPNDNFTVEHPIPRALGTFRGARLLNEHLCERSNRDLSALDAALVRLAPDALFRELAGVKGRSSHKPVSPFYYDPLNPRAVRVLGKHPDAPYDVLWEIDPGTLKGREARQVVFRQGDRTIPIALPDQNIAGFLKQAVQERGLQGAEVLALFGCQEVGDQEFSATLEAIRSVAKAGGPIRSGRVKPGQKIQVWSELPVTREYFRAISKIAFHYVLAYVPGRVFTGHETAFDAAKRFIAAGEDFEERIAVTSEALVQDIARGENLKWYGHFAYADVRYSDIIVRIQLFVGPAVAAPAWVVRLGRNPSYTYTGAFGHGFMLFEEPAADGHQGEVTELTDGSRWFRSR